MSDPSGPSLGRRYEQAADTWNTHRPSLGSQYSDSSEDYTDESSLDLFSGTVILEPRLVDTRSARAVRQSAGVGRRPTPAHEVDPEPGGKATASAALWTAESTRAGSRSTDASVGRSSAIMAAGTLVSRALGLVRQSMLLAALGVVSTSTIDARAANIWDTANTLPNMVFLLLAGGVFNAVLIPQLTRALKDADGGKAYTDRLITLALLTLGAITALCLIFAYPLYRIYDISGSPEILRLGWLFSLLCLPQIFFYGVYTIFGEVLNSRSRFGAFMWSPALANIVYIAGLAWFIAKYAVGVPPGRWTAGMILTLGGASTLGIAAQALVLIIPLRRAGYRYRPSMQFRGIGLRTTGKVAGLAFAAILIQQVGLLVTTNVLNAMDPKYGGRLLQTTALLLFMLPHSIVTVSLITAMYTRISKAANDRDTARVTEDVATAIRLCGVAVVPVTIGAFALVPPGIGVYLGLRGDNGTAISTLSAVTIAMLLGSFPLALNVIVQRTHYAYEDGMKPLLMQVCGTAVVVPLTLLCLLLPGRWVGIGVGVVQSISYCAQAGTGYYWLRKRLGGLPMPGVLHTYGRLTIAAAAAAAAAFAVRWAVGGVVAGQFAGALFGVSIGGTVFVAVYVAVARALKVAEIEALLAPVTSRLSRFTGRAT